MASIYTLPSRRVLLGFLLCAIALPALLRAEHGAARSGRHGSSANAPEITSAMVSRSTYSSGDSIAVGFTTSGTFDNGNVFTAQISSINGSFAQARVIGVLQATSPGVISGKLPCDITDGAGYRVRVIANSPAATSPDNGADITIRPHPVLTITPLTPLSICESDSVVLVASGGYREYRWNNGDSTGLVVLRQSGTYAVTATDSNGCGTVARVTVTMSPLPKPPIREPLYHRLETDSGYATYQWLFRSELSGQEHPIANATSRTIAASMLGYYRVAVSTSAGCVGISDSVHITGDGVAIEHASDAGVRIYPQPTRGRLTIETNVDKLTEISISVIDMSGGRVLQLDPERVAGHYLREISIAALPAGSYMLRLDLGARHLVEKIVKEK
jgi:hypothetical protein